MLSLPFAIFPLLLNEYLFGPDLDSQEDDSSEHVWTLNVDTEWIISDITHWILHGKNEAGSVRDILTGVCLTQLSNGMTTANG